MHKALPFQCIYRFLSGKSVRYLVHLALATATLLPVGKGVLAAPVEGLKVLPFAPATTSGAVPATLFTKLPPEQSGIDFVNPIDNSHPTKRLYLGPFACGGIAIGDVDGDSVADVYLTCGPRRNRLYRGLGGLKYSDVTQTAGVPGTEAWTAGATMVDIDGDGDLDIYVCNYEAPNLLYVNDGKGKFVERAEAFGLAVDDASLMAAFCDYDLDGDLDCFVMTCDFKRAGGRPSKHPVVKEGNSWKVAPGFEKYYDIVRRGPGQVAFVNAGREDYLFRNDGAATNGQVRFTDVSKSAGISGRDRGNSVTWWDYNEDGLPDIYVGNDFKDADRLYHNNGDGTFKDVIREVAPHTPWFAMGADVGDLDGDGRLDLLVADMAGTSHYRSKTTMGEMGTNRPFLLSAIPRQYMHNVLYVNKGANRLADVSFMAGLGYSDWSWAVKISDFDNDGLPDVFFTNGVSRNFNNSDIQRSSEEIYDQTEWDFYESYPTREEQNLAFRNHGAVKFKDASKEWGLDHTGMSYSSATGDLDGDGDLELIVASLDEPVIVYRNDSPASAHRVRVRLVGAGGNSFGLGARVTVVTDAGSQVQALNPATGFLSCNLPELAFGLGASAKISELTVKWQSGHVQEFVNLEADKVYRITEPKAAPPGYQAPSKPVPMYANVDSPSLRSIKHIEKPYDDYARQPLLPYQHSLLGPGLAWADVDGDGDQDFYRSHASGTSGRIYFNEGRGNFTDGGTTPFEAHANSEDLAPLFFDADLDGDPDLYVVSGGVECEPGDPLLRDRLYLNDGTGKFSIAPAGTLPDLRDSGSSVVAADIDRDGDLDLFVGGRVVAGAYPETPSSRLLRNDSQPGKPKFTEITSETQGLEKAGLVTGALWSDANGDGWIDLLVACEWGPVKIFLNNGKGKLAEATEAAGLAQHLGWWNSISGADLDGDGDIDYVATNIGLNTPYKATVEKPEILYYGDLDGTGKKQLVEAKFENGICYPRRGFSCSSSAMPDLRTKLKTFHNFASSTLSEIYTDTRLSKATRFEANTLASSILINDGSARFAMTPLPNAAQVSPAFGVVLSDFTGDGNVDCVLGQNFYGAQPETGWMDAGLGLLLRGRGDGTFDPVEAGESGIFVPDAGMAATTVDLNGDGRPEIAFAENSGRIRVFSEPGAEKAKNRILAVSLAAPGASGFESAGARVTVKGNGLRPMTAEIYAGAGYLSASEAKLWFGLGEIDPERMLEVEVLWPDGTKTRTEVAAGAKNVTIRR
ncbi:MAG: FG-GAP-like repeat-containing protein [Verrucomicrobia bacterium]|nr:FG-GAP-like repeat-containing protein [Verrucomicrobiota bacterium]